MLSPVHDRRRKESLMASTSHDGALEFADCEQPYGQRLKACDIALAAFIELCLGFGVLGLNVVWRPECNYCCGTGTDHCKTVVGTGQ